MGSSDPTFAQTGTPYGVGDGLDVVADAMLVQTKSPNKNASQQFNGRVDYNATSKARFTFSMYWVPLDGHSNNVPAGAANEWIRASLAQSWTGIYTRTFSPAILNEARFGFSGWDWNEFESNPLKP